MKIAIERGQSQASLSFAEREQFATKGKIAIKREQKPGLLEILASVSNLRAANKLTLTLIWFFISVSAINAQTDERQEVDLDGSGWKFAVDMEGNADWQNGLPAGRDVTVPHTWNVEAGLERYHGQAWYEKEITVPSAWKGKKVRLHFDAVFRDAVVYINGREVGHNKGAGFTPFSFDVTDVVKYGESNLLVVSVSNKFSEYAFPYKESSDWPNDGGIIRPVKLIITRGDAVRYAHIRTDVNFADSSATGRVKIRTWNDTRKRAGFIITFSERSTGKVILTKRKELTADDGIFSVDVEFENILPWHFDSPTLYEMKVELVGKKEIEDRLSTHFGFREVKIEGDKFFLNGEEVRLPGIEYMAGSYPSFGMAEPVWVLEQAVAAMKELNCVITRFHWQQDSRLLDMMDEKGILVQQEIPWWQAPGNLDPELEELARKHIDLMIERDFNRPCIFSWGISNEVFHNTEKEIYRRLIANARKWDSGALVAVVSNEIFDRLENDESLLGDIPTWNDYTGTWHGKSREETPGKLQLINERALRGRPLLITEHGLCEPRFTGGDARRITEMTYHYDQWARNEYIMGAIYFSLNDYRTHRGESGKGRYMQRVHGLTDLWFGRKPSFDVYRELCSPVYFESVRQKAEGTEAEVVIVIKDNLPKYTVINYKLVWETAFGMEKEVSIPTLQPGGKFQVIIDELDPGKKPFVKVVRPTGYVAAVNY